MLTGLLARGPIPLYYQIAWQLRRKIHARQGAAAMGLADQIGSLTPRKKAHVIVVDLQGPQFRPLFPDGPLANLVAMLVFTATGRDVRDVIVDGQVVVRDRRVLTVDEERVKAKCQARGERILRSISGN